MSKSPSLRRIQADVRELALDPSDRYHAAPLEDDMFEWHFTIRGADDTDFQGGVYHGRILLPPEYPFKPPHIMFLTPSGRFETNTKICLSFSAFHPELWQPAWGIRLILEALIAFLPSPADGAIGALDWTSAERKRLALRSQSFVCPRCGKVADLLPECKKKSADDGNDEKKPKSRFEKEIEQLKLAQVANESKNPKTKSDGGKEAKEEKEDDGKAKAAPTEEVESSKKEEEDAAKTPELATEETPSPPPIVPAPDAAPAAPVVDNEVAANPYEMDVSWMTDPMLNLAIVLLSTICFLLGRKALEMLEELQSLNARS